jgi:hypothetical protein
LAPGRLVGVLRRIAAVVAEQAFCAEVFAADG